MRVLTVPIMEGIDGEEEDRMSATTDSLDTSNDDKHSRKPMLGIKGDLIDINETNLTKNEKLLHHNTHNISKIDNNDNENEIAAKTELRTFQQKTFVSYLPFPTSSDTTDKTYHESENFSIVLGTDSVENLATEAAIFLDKTSTLLNDKITIENSEKLNDSLEEKSSDKERIETNPRDELIMSFATAILKAGTRSTDSQNDNKSGIEFHSSPSSENSRRNSQLNSASGIMSFTHYKRE